MSYENSLSLLFHTEQVLELLLRNRITFDDLDPVSSLLGRYTNGVQDYEKECALYFGKHAFAGKIIKMAEILDYKITKDKNSGALISAMPDMPVVMLDSFIPDYNDPSVPEYKEHLDSGNNVSFYVDGELFTK